MHGQIFKRSNGSPQPHAQHPQWAIEIAAQFPKAEVEIRLSTNLDTWLHEITDEDDRDDIKNWAGKVKDGKMLEDKFIEKVKNMN